MRQGSHVTKKKRKKYLRCNHWKRMQRYKPLLCFESFNFFLSFAVSALHTAMWKSTLLLLNIYNNNNSMIGGCHKENKRKQHLTTV